MFVHVSVIEKKGNGFYNLFYDEKQPLVYSGKKRHNNYFVPESDIRMLQYRQKAP